MEVVIATLGLVVVILVHLLDPSSAMTWSYSGLHRHALLPWLAGALVVVLPTLADRAWRLPGAERPAPALSPRAAAATVLVLWATLALLGWLWPAPNVCPDVLYLRHAVETGQPHNPRWLLAVGLLDLLFAPLRGTLPATRFIALANALFTALAITATVALAVRSARSRREAVAILALVWTALGNLQLAFGYVDIYPIVQLLCLLYCWAAVRFFDGDGSPFWPVAIAVAGPTFYIGLILLLPSLLWIAVHARATGRLRSLAAAVVASLALSGLATVPRFGRPFAVTELLAALATAASRRGLNPHGSLLPLDYMLSLRHLAEFMHSLLLLDGSGVVLCVALLPGGVLLRSAGATRRLLLTVLTVLVGALAYVFAMDPLWGPYSDWDLFSYVATVTSVLAGLGFVLWSRDHARRAGLLLGLALAASSTHLLAKLNALDHDFDRHLVESPVHLPGIPPGLFADRPR